jgi:hypothetical protein
MRPGTRVLVIEDDDYTARLLKLQLEHRDLKVRCEYDEPSGLKAAVQFDPEVIVLDIMLPGLDGVGRARGTVATLGKKIGKADETQSETQSGIRSARGRGTPARGKLRWHRIVTGQFVPPAVRRSACTLGVGRRSQQKASPTVLKT